MRPRILFYSSVASKKQFVVQEYYRTDIQILRSLGFDVFLSRHWYDYLAFWRYDVAFIYFYRYGLIPAILARITGKGVVFSGGIDALDRLSSSWAQHKIQALFYNLCSFFSSCNIIVSEADLANCERVRRLFPARRQLVSKHAVNDLFLAPVSADVKEKLVVTIAWMGRTENVVRKGVIEAIDFFRKLSANGGGWRMLIIGSIGEGSTIVLSHLEGTGLSNQVSLSGHVSEATKLNLLAQAEVYLQLSRYEGFGIAAIEALARDCVVVHSGAGGLREGVGAHGILWDAKAPDTAVDATLALLADGSRLQSWRCAGRQHVTQHFSVAARAQGFKVALGPWVPQENSAPPEVVREI
jgi:glycosyltransferase involved in cell wall biosynthesis